MYVFVSTFGKPLYMKNLLSPVSSTADPAKNVVADGIDELATKVNDSLADGNPAVLVSVPGTVTALSPDALPVVPAWLEPLAVAVKVFPTAGDAGPPIAVHTVFPTAVIVYVAPMVRLPNAAATFLWPFAITVLDCPFKSGRFTSPSSFAVIFIEIDVAVVLPCEIVKAVATLAECV